MREPSPYLLITHFGNGDERDQDVLHEFCSNHGGPIKSLNIFPGANYGHLEYDDKASAEQLLASMEVPNCANIRFEGCENLDRTVVFLYTPLQCMELKKSILMEIPVASVAKTGSIPGLYVFDNFITAEEEQQMIQDIDKGKWIKLLNRRV